MMIMMTMCSVSQSQNTNTPRPLGTRGVSRGATRVPDRGNASGVARRYGTHAPVSGELPAPLLDPPRCYAATFASRLAGPFASSWLPRSHHCAALSHRRRPGGVTGVGHVAAAALPKPPKSGTLPAHRPMRLWTDYSMGVPELTSRPQDRPCCPVGLRLANGPGRPSGANWTLAANSQAIFRKIAVDNQGFLQRISSNSLGARSEYTTVLISGWNPTRLQASSHEARANNPHK